MEMERVLVRDENQDEQEKREDQMRSMRSTSNKSNDGRQSSRQQEGSSYIDELPVGKS